MSDKCYCGSGNEFLDCCKPYISGKNKPATAEQLMRSRYSAYCIHDADYLIATTHITTRKYHHKEDILSFAIDNNWLKLEIIKSSAHSVEFKAYYLDSSLNAHTHHEKSAFKKEGDQWFYVDGKWY